MFVESTSIGKTEIYLDVLCGQLDLRPIDGVPDVEERNLFVNRFRTFLCRARIEDDDLIRGRDVPSCEECLERRKANRGLGADRQTFECDRLSHPWLDGAFGYRDRRSAARPNGVKFHEVPDRDRYPDTAGDGRRVFEYRGKPLAIFKGPDDGRVSLTLAGD